MLLITAGDRPASVWYRNGEVFIHAHDEQYLRMCRHMLALLRQAHPDRNAACKDGRRRNGTGFTRIKHALVSYQRQERAWYAMLGLKPPKVTHKALPAKPNTQVLNGMRVRAAAQYKWWLPEVYTSAPTTTKAA